jgi:ubiquinone/menaquinone biosynthesis C-methylase UbiE
VHGHGSCGQRYRSPRNCRVVGVDLAHGMIKGSAAKSGRPACRFGRFAHQARAESLPFPMGHSMQSCSSSDTSDPRTALRELARWSAQGTVEREFSVPENPVLRRMWLLHAHLVLPLGTRLLSSQWRRVGSFLGPSIAGFHKAHPLRLTGDVERCRPRQCWRALAFGGALAMGPQAGMASLSRPAYYALAEEPGGTT